MPDPVELKYFACTTWRILMLNGLGSRVYGVM